MQTVTLLRKCSTIVLLGGVCVLGTCGFLLIEAHIYRGEESRQFESLVHHAVEVGGRSKTLMVAKPGSVVGKLEIPRIGIDALVLEGDDAGILGRAAGHIPGTALPDDSRGNVGIAAHRDTFFRPLRHVRPNDLIILRTLTGTYQYRVHSTEVVEPGDTAVLENTGRPSLTLVTCYPFHFIGSAPRRFVVRATEIPPTLRSLGPSVGTKPEIGSGPLAIDDRDGPSSVGRS
jgi:sortase A